MSVLIGELHNMTLNQTFSEEAHMVSIRYHGYGHHLHDHHRLAIATARLRNEAELGLCTVQELQTLREQWVQHIQCFDNALESHLIANQAQAGLDDKNS
ncbi:hypothetical protein FY034_18370 (plasmid) [Trichlorobacter lovleyi]|nr:hypothetical protein FY034_18370 [Trichlorobacter lovleyi]